MRKINPVSDGNLIALTETGNRAGEIAEAVNGDACGFLEPGDEERGREMSQVMFHIVQLRFDLVSVGFLELFLYRGRAADVFDFLPHQPRAGSMTENKRQSFPIVSARLAINCDVLD